jgi:hypothetical protein
MEDMKNEKKNVCIPYPVVILLLSFDNNFANVDVD